jgi:ubiquinone/menaquinone biosynthesis C-methylase UbiE
VYVKGDLFPQSKAMLQISVTSLPFPDDCFDLAICNHVLEHVRDDQMALVEFFRVIKSGGCAVLQTPYSSLLADSFDDENVNTAELRRKLYGQEDHVRVYGQDLFAKIKAAGFTLHLKPHEHVLAASDAWHLGVNPDEDLILAVKG